MTDSERTVLENADLLPLILDWLRPRTCIDELIERGPQLCADALSTSLLLCEVNHQFRVCIRSEVSEMYSSLIRAMLLFDDVAFEWLHPVHSPDVPPRFPFSDVLYAIRIFKFLYGNVQISMDVFDEPIDFLVFIGQLRRPRCVVDVLNLLNRRCMISTEQDDEDDRSWFQHPYIGELHESLTPQLRWRITPQLQGQWIPFTSQKHFVRVTFYWNCGQPAMRLHVDSSFTSSDTNFLKFRNAIKLSEYANVFRRLFELRPESGERYSAQDTNKALIVSLPLFNIGLRPVLPDSSIAAIFHKTDHEMRRLIRKGGRVMREKAKLR